MSYTLFIDESGNMLDKSEDRYFCIGGYLINTGNKQHVFKMKKFIKNINEDRDLYFNYYAKRDNKTEVKFSNLNLRGKQKIFDDFKILEGTFVSIIVDKQNCTNLNKHKYNDYYNYLVHLLIKYVFEVRNFAHSLEFDELKIICDNRSMKVNSNNDLQAYLIKELKMKRRKGKQYCCNFNIKLADSKVNYGVMIADFIAGLCRARYTFEKLDFGNNIKLNYVSKFPYKDFGKDMELKKVIDKH